jgi:bifunctional UDP-N-acetylglucosamine pyrophosphorylase / glucosamine-1-phosphate N-acetyltransferase
VITQDVPADALALGRSRQVVKQGWAARLRGLKTLGRKKKA